MKIIKNTIYFKSDPVHYEKEKTGLKNNTLRELDAEELREVKHTTIRYITIACSDGRESFSRKISDITHFKGMTIFSWFDPKLPNML